MRFTPLPFRSPLGDYEKQAGELFAAWQSGDEGAVRIFHEKHPRFLDEKIAWLPKRISEDEIRSAPLALEDARLALARLYDSRDWQALEQWVASIHEEGSEAARFEAAVEAVISGDLASLRRLLQEHPDLVRARSMRVNCFDPPQHRATLLHYIAANGVEGYRQKTPANAEEVARTLLESGSDPNALADMYGGQCSVMSMLVSSGPPAEAGLQVPLMEALVDYGASLEPLGTGNWQSPLMTALVFGFTETAEALVRRGARIATMPEAAGLGRGDEVRRMLPDASPVERHRALAIAAQLGRTEVVRLLLDAGEDPNRFNPDGMHAHATPLHHAALSGREEVVRLLLEHGARLDIKDTIWQATPLGWAEHGGHPKMAEYLRARAS